MKEKIRFENKIVGEDVTNCWLWKGYKDKDGYGTFSFNGKPIQAHRASWKIYIGEIPENKYVCHKCDNTSCVNPEHLFLGTNSDNMQDMQNKGRDNYAKGSSVGGSKLTDKEILYIRNSSKTQKELAVEFGVTRSNISYIKSRKSWKHLT